MVVKKKHDFLLVKESSEPLSSMWSLDLNSIIFLLGISTCFEEATLWDNCVHNNRNNLQRGF